MPKRYPWTRFWTPRGTPPLLDIGGYLAGPESIFAPPTGSKLKTLEQLRATPCLVLLGEPGAGKTTEIRGEAEGLAAARATFLRLDLNRLSSASDPGKKILDSPEVREWLDGGIGEMTLLLDSLDECRIEIPLASRMLEDAFKVLPRERLRVRISCRPADWPQTLEDALNDLWPSAPASVYELAPLRRCDVASALAANGVTQADQFFNAVAEMSATPFALKPVTLDFLVEAFKESGSLPGTQRELFETGCLHLSRETPERIDIHGHTGKLSALERIAIASRIAAATLFSNRECIYTGTTPGAGNSDIAVEVLVGGREPVTETNGIPVSREAVEETLGCGLFARRESGRVAWFHRAFEEYLAARFIAQQQIPVAQSVSLLTHATSPNGAIVPQLHEAAGWAALLRSELFDHIAEHDPLVLVTSDAHLANDTMREKITHVVLSNASALGWDSVRGFKRLSHPGLACQLQPYLVKAGVDRNSRDAALLIATRCRVSGLDGQAAELALDTGIPSSTREHAAGLVARTGSTESRQRLRSLFLDSSAELEDGLRGNALSALWPEILTSKELFACLRLPRRNSVGDPYYNFLSSLPDTLTPSTIAEALSWVRDQQANTQGFEGLIEAILLLGWKWLDQPGVARALASALWHRAVHGADARTRTRPAPEPPFEDKLSFLREFVLFRNSHVWAFHTARAVGFSSGDIARLVASARECPDSELKLALAEVALHVWNPADNAGLDVLWEASQADPFLAPILGIPSRPVLLASCQATILRDEYAHMQSAANRKVQAEIDGLKITANAVENIAAAAEDAEAWWKANYYLACDTEGRLNEHEMDLSKLPGWPSLQNEQIETLSIAARSYVLNAPISYSDWSDPKQLCRPAAAGYRALRFLARRDPQFVAELSNSTWSRWATSIVNVSATNDENEDLTAQFIRRMAFEHAPAKMAEAVGSWISQREPRLGLIPLRRIWNCWCPELETLLLQRVVDETLPPDAFKELLIPLLVHNSSAALELAIRTVRHRQTEAAMIRAIAAACAMLNGLADAGWPTIWPEIQHDPRFGMGFFEATVEAGAMSLAPRLSAQQKAELTVWLFQQYPPLPPISGAQYANRSRMVGHVRDNLLQTLAGTGRADELRWVAQDLPQYPWLSRVVRDAEIARAGSAWVPAQPIDIVKLSLDRDARLVRSSRELQDLILQALREVERGLHGADGMVRLLWENGNPKPETDISRYVAHELKHHLDRWAVAANREVQILPANNRTDIKLQATAGEPSSVPVAVSVIIEAKGSWHPELISSMKDQLVDTYVAGEGSQHGIYLIYWVGAPEGLTEARAKYDAMAQALSVDGIVIKSAILNCVQCPSNQAKGIRAAVRKPSRKRNHKPTTKAK